MATKEIDRDRSADVRSATDRKSLGNYCVKLASPDKAPVRSRTSETNIGVYMATIALSTFSQFNQTESEQLSATALTTETKQFIQTELSKIAEQRLALIPDPNNYAAFIQQEAHLKGQMDFARWLLDCALETEKRILEISQEPQQ